MAAAPTPPSVAVLDAFGLRGPSRRLAGGQGDAHLADGAVLKRADDVTEAAWIQNLASRLDPEVVRVARPIPTTEGAWIHESWTACEFVPDLTPAAPDWVTVIEAGRAFATAASAIADLDTLPLARRTHRWAVADRCAWGEETVELRGRGQRVQAALRELTLTGDHASQVVHADLAGNVHLDRAGVPVVLDISPYLRPVRWGDAIVVADAVTWHGAPVELVTSFAADATGRDLLARALIFRLVAEQLGPLAGTAEALEPYESLVGGLARSW